MKLLLTAFLARAVAGSTPQDSCPAIMNMGPLLSASTDYQQDFPRLVDPTNIVNPIGRDDAIAFFVKGNYVSAKAAEIEGKIVVLGDFTAGDQGAGNSLNSLVHAGFGSGILPNDGQVIMTVGGNLILQTTGNIGVLDKSSGGGGDVVHGGSYEKQGGGKLTVGPSGAIRQANLDLSSYEDLFEELEVKSHYWSTLVPNGIITSALEHSSSNVIVFSAGDDDCLQVFHANKINMASPGYAINVEFDSSLEGKTILINVAPTGQDENGDNFVTLHDWADFIDVAKNQGKNFKSSTKASILWNFYDAKTVTLGPGGGPQFPGSILVPDGNLSLLWPGQDGRTIVGGNVYQNSPGSEFHNYEFDPPCPLPLPPQIAIPPECNDGTSQEDVAAFARRMNVPTPATVVCIENDAPDYTTSTGAATNIALTEDPIEIIKRGTDYVEFIVTHVWDTSQNPLSIHFHDSVSSTDCDQNSLTSGGSYRYTAYCFNNVAHVGINVFFGEYETDNCQACDTPPEGSDDIAAYYFEISCDPLCPVEEEVVCIESDAPDYTTSTGAATNIALTEDPIEIIKRGTDYVEFIVTHVWDTSQNPLSIHFHDSVSSTVCDQNGLTSGGSYLYTAYCFDNVAHVGINVFFGEYETDNCQACDTPPEGSDDIAAYYFEISCDPLCPVEEEVVCIESDAPDYSTSTGAATNIALTEDPIKIIKRGTDYVEFSVTHVWDTSQNPLSIQFHDSVSSTDCDQNSLTFGESYGYTAQCFKNVTDVGIFVFFGEYAADNCQACDTPPEGSDAIAAYYFEIRCEPLCEDEPTAEPTAEPTPGPTPVPTTNPQPSSSPTALPTILSTSGPTSTPDNECLMEMGKTGSDICVGSESVKVASVKVDLSVATMPNGDELVFDIEFKGSAEAPEVSFKVDNPFDFDVDMYIRYDDHELGTRGFKEECYKDLAVSGCDLNADSITAACLNPAGKESFAIVSVYFVSNNSFLGTGGGVDVLECCDAEVNDNDKVVEYTLLINCECPMMTQRQLRDRNDGRRLGRATEGYLADRFASLTKKEAEVASASSTPTNGQHFCAAEDYPCDESGDLVYVCHYSAKLGYQTFCVPEPDSDVLGFYPKDHCGPCAGGYGTRSR